MNTKHPAARASVIRKPTEAASKKYILDRLACLHKDFTLLENGDWVPDRHSCEASRHAVEDIFKELKDLGVLGAQHSLEKAIKKAP